MTGPMGPYELVDNVDYGSHDQALSWLAEHYSGSLHVATGYVSLEGLDSLAKLGSEREHPSRLLIGTAPETLVGSPRETVANRFQHSVLALRRERDFSAFPAARRAVLERLTEFFESERVEVRRYTQRFLHGKAYAIGQLNDSGVPAGPGAALVSSANLTQGGLATNLELGMVHYQPNVVGMTLQWHQRLWDNADDFRERLLDLLRPPLLESDPQTVFLRALLELYEGELDDVPPTPRVARPHCLPAGWVCPGKAHPGGPRRGAVRRWRGHGQDRDRPAVCPGIRPGARTACAGHFARAAPGSDCGGSDSTRITCRVRWSPIRNWPRTASFPGMAAGAFCRSTRTSTA